ncbi:MAG: 50S ribosomal protein L21 [Acidobacteria bacterium]|nr:50S ribosomal protein L21 [Acidobacteriota bacterium]
MYAIIKVGGKQYRVEQGDVIQVERLPLNVDERVTFHDVLLLDGEDGIKAGNPTVADALVSGVVCGHGKARKIIVFKFKRRKMYRNRRGHRQPFTTIRIDKIELAGKVLAGATTEAKERKTRPAAGSPKAGPPKPSSAREKKPVAKAAKKVAKKEAKTAGRKTATRKKKA